MRSQEPRNQPLPEDGAAPDDAALLQSAHALAGTGHWLHDLQGGQVEACAGASALFGLPAHAYRGPLAPLRAQVLADDLAAFDAAHATATPAAPASVAQWRVRQPDGTPRWLREQACTRFDAQGRAVARAGVLQDVTALRQAQQQAQAARERFALLSIASRDAFWDWDVAAGRFWWDANFAAACGATAGGGLAAWAAHIHPEDRARVLRRMEQACAGSAATWSESYRLRADGEVVPQVIGRACLQRDAAGRVLRMVGCVTDVSERLGLEEQLRQAQRLESVGLLTGGVAHDFNNLLTVILGNVEVLEEALAGDPPLQALAQVVAAAADRGAELTQRLLSFARKQPLAPRVVDLDERVAGLVPLLRRTLGAQVEVGYTGAAQLWPALVDPVQLDNSLLNLCLNARDAMPQGGRLAIRADNQVVREPLAGVAPGDYVVLSIADTGCGIAPELLGQVFQPFFTTKAQGKGTGLGLVMVQGFARQSGGDVLLDSAPGRGTRVRIFLPRACRAEAPGAAPVAGLPAPQPWSRGQSILLVEDEEMVRRVACAQLAAEGYRVLPARDAAQALALLEGGEPVDLLFTDLVMPGVGGRELADRARQLRPGLRVLYTSGYTDPVVLRQGRLEPGMPLLAKPYRREELTRRVGQLLAAW